MMHTSGVNGIVYFLCHSESLFLKTCENCSIIKQILKSKPKYNFSLSSRGLLCLLLGVPPLKQIFSDGDCEYDKNRTSVLGSLNFLCSQQLCVEQRVSSNRFYTV